MRSSLEMLHVDRFEKRGVRDRIRAALTASAREPRYPLEFRSQFGEDALILTLLGDQLDGFFIEAGAFDGYTCAATYALECIGWTGLLVEAIPERVEECRNRRVHSRVVHAALGRTDGGSTILTVADDSHGGMFSRVEAARGKSKKFPSRNVRVPATTLDALLADRHGAVDAAVIDVEGSEADLLAGFDLRKHQPKILLIEDNSRGADQTVQACMAPLPYTQVAWLKVNRVYVRDDLADGCALRLAQSLRSLTASSADGP